MERDELVKTVQNMKNEFSSIKKENEELKVCFPCCVNSVWAASSILVLCRPRPTQFTYHL